MIITAVTMAKNEENLIESFVRHALSFADNLIVYDHNSTDGTGAILNALKGEFNNRLILWREEEITLKIINQEVYNRMAKYAFDKLVSDIVMPLDADEFPVCPEKKDIRKYLLGLNREKCYFVHFMPFAIPKEWRNDVFAPFLFTKRKKLNRNTDMKVLLMRAPFYKYKPILGLGNHLIDRQPDEEEIPMGDVFPNLFYAHYPFRSIEHLENKLVTRQLALSMRADIAHGLAFQYVKGFNEVKEGGVMSVEETDWYCLNNMCGGIGNMESLEAVQDAVEYIDPTELFEAHQLKYTKELSINKSNYRLLLEFAESLTSQYAKQTLEIESLYKKIDGLQKENLLYRNSTSWKITAPLRKIMNLLKK